MTLRGEVTFGSPSWRFVITDETGEVLARGTLEEFDDALRAIAERLKTWRLPKPGAGAKQQGQLNIIWERLAATTEFATDEQIERSFDAYR